jgi:hypothetical protein
MTGAPSIRDKISPSDDEAQKLTDLATTAEKHGDPPPAIDIFARTPCFSKY